MTTDDERDAALAENARLRTVLAALCDAAEVALRGIDGYDAILGPLAEAVEAAGVVLRTDGEIVWCGSFASFEEWCNKARSWLACDSGAVGRENPVVCEDAKGRRCDRGSDFMLARDEVAFPVRFGWPARCIPARYRGRP